MGKQIVAGGGVVYRRTSKGIKILLVHRPNYDDWSLPKGKLDRGESIRECAFREVQEETGFTVHMGPHLGKIEYITPGGYDKDVDYWAMPLVSGSFVKNKEVDDIVWLKPKKAKAQLTYKRDREFLAGLPKRWWDLEPAVYLVRHAHAGERSAWEGDDKVRPLSHQGAMQSHGIADSLVNNGITRLISSPYTRCYQTLEPLGELLSLEVERHSALAEDAKPKATMALLKELSSTRAAVVTHGDVIFNALQHLANEGMRLKPPVDAKKASIWVLRAPDGTFSKGEYIPPPN